MERSRPTSIWRRVALVALPFAVGACGSGRPMAIVLPAPSASVPPPEDTPAPLPPEHGKAIVPVVETDKVVGDHLAPLTLVAYGGCYWHSKILSAPWLAKLREELGPSGVRVVLKHGVSRASREERADVAADLAWAEGGVDAYLRACEASYAAEEAGKGERNAGLNDVEWEDAIGRMRPDKEEQRRLFAFEDGFFANGKWLKRGLRETVLEDLRAEAAEARAAMEGGALPGQVYPARVDANYHIVDRLPESAQTRVALDVAGAPARGAADAPATIVLFGDPLQQPTTLTRELRAAHGDAIREVFRFRSDRALSAMVYAVALEVRAMAGDEAFWRVIEKAWAFYGRIAGSFDNERSRFTLVQGGTPKEKAEATRKLDEATEALRGELLRVSASIGVALDLQALTRALDGRHDRAIAADRDLSLRLGVENDTVFIDGRRFDGTAHAAESMATELVARPARYAKGAAPRAVDPWQTLDAPVMATDGAAKPVLRYVGNLTGAAALGAERGLLERDVGKPFGWSWSVLVDAGRLDVELLRARKRGGSAAFFKLLNGLFAESAKASVQVDYVWPYTTLDNLGIDASSPPSDSELAELAPWFADEKRLGRRRGVVIIDGAWVSPTDLPQIARLLRGAAAQ